MGTSGTNEQIERADGRVELAEGVDLAGSHLYNEDLAPTPLAKRTWMSLIHISEPTRPY